MLFNLALISEKASSKHTFFSKKFVSGRIEVGNNDFCALRAEPHIIAVEASAPCPSVARHCIKGELVPRARAQPRTTRHTSCVATLSGLEPELSGPKPLVLPLHHRVTKNSVLYFSTFSRKVQLKARKRMIFTCRAQRKERTFAATASAMASGVKPCSSRIFAVEPCGMISSASQP